MALFHGRLSRGALGVALAISLGVVGATPANAEPGDVLWYDYFRTFFTYEKVLVTASGQVFAVGYGGHWGSDSEYLTVSLDRDGNELWSAIYRGPDQGDPASDTDRATDAALGPSEHRLYVTGSSEKPDHGSDWATVAYRTDGTQLWVRRYDGPASGEDGASAVAVSQRTGRIFVTGRSAGDKSDTSITTVAYSPGGERLWTRRYDSPASDPGATAPLDTENVLVSPNGRRLYVSGSVATKNGNRDAVLLAYRANGSRLWRRQFDGLANDVEVATDAVLGPNARHIYLTGGSEGDYLTLCYRRDGARLWVRRYDGPIGGDDIAAEAVVAPDGLTLFVTGQSEATASDDVATVAYTSQGDRLWVARDASSRDDPPADLAVSPDGGQVFVANGDVISNTTAFTVDGDPLWTRNNEGAESNDIAASPDGSFAGCRRGRRGRLSVPGTRRLLGELNATIRLREAIAHSGLGLQIDRPRRVRLELSA